MTGPRLRAQGLCWSHDGRRVLDDLDLEVMPGELLAVVGPTDVGKTALLHVLAGVTPPDAGRVWTHDAAGPLGGAALVPQSIALVDELTVAENVALAALISSGRPVAGLDELLASLGLDRLRARMADEISVGERQRTMVARAVAGAPSLVLADEPTAHQDQRHADAVLAQLRAVADRGGACVVASRSPATASAVATRTVELVDGRLAER